MIEIWKDVFGYENAYQISNLGRLKSLERKVKTKGDAFRVKKEKTVKLKFNRFNGYLFHQLSINGIKKNFHIHRLVALAFIPKIENKPEVNHIDGNKSNNHISNLEWCTKSENMSHSYKTNLHKPTKGSINGMAKLTEEIVFQIKNEYHNEGVTVRSLAISHNVADSCISRIVHGKRWPHVILKTA